MRICTKDIFSPTGPIATKHTGTVAIKHATCTEHSCLRTAYKAGPVAREQAMPCGTHRCWIQHRGSCSQTQTRVSAGAHHVVLHEVTDCFPSACRDEIRRVPQKDGTVCHRATPLVEQGFLDGSLGDRVPSTHKLWKKYRDTVVN